MPLSLTLQEWITLNLKHLFLGWKLMFIYSLNNSIKV